MAANTAQRNTAAPILSWEKAQQQHKTSNKKNSPLLIVGIAAVILLALAGLWRFSHQQHSGQWLEVMAARRDIPAGARLGITTVSFLRVPKKYTTEDMIRSLNDVAGRMTKSYIPAGEPIQKFMLLPAHESLAADLETHERAITLQLDDDALVDHSIQCGDRVDLLVVSSSKNQKYTKTICQDLRVLMSVPREQSLARNLSTPTNKITLAVLPDQAELITEAIEAGKIRLVLRSRVSRMQQHLAGVSPDDLLPSNAIASLPDPVEAKVPIAAPPPPAETKEPETTNPWQWMVEVILGNHKETYAVPSQ